MERYYNRYDMLGPCCPIQLGTVWNPNWVQKISIISKHSKTATVITMPSCQVSNSLGCWVKYSLRATKAKLRRYETTGSMTRAYQSSSTMPHFTLRFRMSSTTCMAIGITIKSIYIYIEHDERQFRVHDESKVGTEKP